ncbi:hypothetical protein DF020_01810 [Burkholderia cenocepacia]|nr:hypothetical protein DF020_01810 [Burkholderia cenocepacia]
MRGCGVACRDGDRPWSVRECVVRQRDRRPRPLLGRGALHDRVVASHRGKSPIAMCLWSRLRCASLRGAA